MSPFFSLKSFSPRTKRVSMVPFVVAAFDFSHFLQYSLSFSSGMPVHCKNKPHCLDNAWQHSLRFFPSKGRRGVPLFMYSNASFESNPYFLLNFTINCCWFALILFLLILFLFLELEKQKQFNFFFLQKKT